MRHIFPLDCTDSEYTQNQIPEDTFLVSMSRVTDTDHVVSIGRCYKSDIVSIMQPADHSHVVNIHTVIYAPNETLDVFTFHLSGHQGHTKNTIVFPLRFHIEDESLASISLLQTVSYLRLFVFTRGFYVWVDLCFFGCPFFSRIIPLVLRGFLRYIYSLWLHNSFHNFLVKTVETKPRESIHQIN